MRRRFTAFAVLLCFVCLLAAGAGPVYGKDETKQGRFRGEMSLLKQDGNNYVMQVTVENGGEDFAGAVQAVFSGSRDNCAYETPITLASQGKKQFTITVPERAVETVRGMCALNFLDEHGKVLQTVSLKNVFGNTVTGIPVGILSDNYSGLTYMDAGGSEFYLQSSGNPLQLIELTAENLSGYLDGLYFLVIDQYDTSSLGEENIALIQDWVKDGGWLIIGTGAYAEQTLSGLNEDFLGLDLLGVSEPGQDNAAARNAVRNGFYYSYTDSGVDFNQMAVAELDYFATTKQQAGNYFESSENPGICGGVDEGAVSILFFSLGDEEMKKVNDSVVSYIYEETMYNSSSYQNINGSSNMDYVGQRALSFIDNRNTNLDFTGLKVLIAVYVVVVGPVLYLILRKGKKSEWYWVCAPVLGMICIAGVFFFGQSARVNETKVYSVTAQQAGSSRADTYFLAYHSGVKPWSLRLNEGYDVAGPGWSGYYGYVNGSASDYLYRVRNDGDGLTVGMKPRTNFENGFLYAGGKSRESGAITAEKLKGSGVTATLSGTVKNDTARDFAYMSVMFDGYIMVFSDVKAGETLDLAAAVKDGRCVFQEIVAYYDSLIYDMVSIYSSGNNVGYEQEAMAALLCGIGIAEDNQPYDTACARIVGVVKDYEKAVADKCSEKAWGCIYSYAEMEVKEHAAN